MNTKRLTRNALLTGLAVIIFVIELQIPTLNTIPGLKLGLSNIVTIFAVFVLSPIDAACILASRILLGSLVAGNLSAVMYSAVGGLFCYLLMMALKHVLTARQIWIASVLGAIAHNFGQILVAVVLTRTVYLFAYLPILTIGGMIAGLFTGLCGQYLVNRVDLSK